ncbi:MAG: hypothetical protein MUF15_21380 [Acidobacteria bacterium]|jgi:hypothetical protein|nr:hypothetical protein [Acidobacteriota bacterium]
MKLLKQISKVLFIVGFWLLLTENIYSLILQNGSDKGYDPPPQGIGYTMENSIDTYIEIGGGYFLKSHSDILLFMNKIEMSNINGSNYNEWQNILNSALNNLRKAKNTYAILIKTAEATPYNHDVIAKLESFDYASFAALNNLNGILFKEVEQNLGAGKVTECYKNAYARMCNIEKFLSAISSEVVLQKMPDISMLWKVNNLYAETLITGQYVAMVFSGI